MKANQAAHPIATMCRVLGVSASGYYAWHGRGASARGRTDQELLAQIRAFHRQSRGTYGAPRIHRDLRAAGVPPESVDLVICTHLHVDHVGWNTRLDSGRWVPTFPRARHLFAREEWEHWSSERDDDTRRILADSVQPVLDAGLATLVEMDHRVSDELWLEPTPGHTPGHVSVRLRSGDGDAVITGDLMHHPVQIAEPRWGSHFDTDMEQARKTRRAFCERYADGPVTVLGTHFHHPTAGRIRRHGETWRFTVEE